MWVCACVYVDVRMRRTYERVYVHERVSAEWRDASVRARERESTRRRHNGHAFILNQSGIPRSFHRVSSAALFSAERRERAPRAYPRNVVVVVGRSTDGGVRDKTT